MAVNVLPPDLVERRSDEREVFALVNALKRIIAGITASGSATTINIVVPAVQLTDADTDPDHDAGAFMMPPGAVGAMGATGSTGPQGVQGIRGLDGDDGDDGAIGLPGAPGKSGNDGRTIFGMDGDDGLDGIALPALPGAPGPPGPTPAQALDGDDGLDGLPGLPGRPGNTGQQGLPGMDGADGDDGVVPPTNRGFSIGFSGLGFIETDGTGNTYTRQGNGYTAVYGLGLGTTLITSDSYVVMGPFSIIDGNSLSIADGAIMGVF